MTTAAKPKPIIFTGQSVPQIQSDLKTMTRRVVKRLSGIGAVTEFGLSDTKGYDWTFRDQRMRWHDLTHDELMARCPYTVGQLLWVREAWAVMLPPPIEEWPIDKRVECTIWRATSLRSDEGRWRSPIFMPRWASRLTLEVTAVRVERVQEISEADAIAEGIQQEDVCPGGFDPDNYVSGLHPFPQGKIYKHATEAFAELWDSLHAKPKPVKRGGKIIRYESFPWESGYEEREHRGLPHLVYGNPWVFPIRFKRVEQ